MKTLVNAVNMARRGRTPSGTPLEALAIRFMIIDPEGFSVAGAKRFVNNLVAVPEALELSRLYNDMTKDVSLPTAA